MRCSACQTELQASVRFCPTCGKAVQAVGTPNRCPVCNQTDKINKVSAVVDKGRRNVQGTTDAWVADKDGGGHWSPTSYSETHITQLAQQLSPPAQPERPHGIGCMLGGVLGGVIFGAGSGGLLCFLIVLNALSSGSSSNSAFNAIGTIAFTIFGIIALFVAFALSRVYSRTDKKAKEDSNRRYAIEKPAWEKQCSNWEHCYYCERDDVVFDTLTGRSCSPKDFKSFLAMNSS